MPAFHPKIDWSGSFVSYSVEGKVEISMLKSHIKTKNIDILIY